MIKYKKYYWPSEEAKKAFKNGMPKNPFCFVKNDGKYISYYKYGVLHRLDGPARITSVTTNFTGPSNEYYIKLHRYYVRGKEHRSTELHFGRYGLKSMETGRLTARQIEATRRAITRKMRRVGKLWIRIFPDIPVTAKPEEVRMGKGKGPVDHWVCRIREGRILFELDGVSPDLAKEAFRCGAAKLPIATKFMIVPLSPLSNIK